MKIRATRARDEYSVQLNLTNSFQRGFYRETWPNVFTKLRRVGQDAEEGVNDLVARLVSGGLDQWPEPVEAWGELDNCRELLDFKGNPDTRMHINKGGPFSGKIRKSDLILVDNKCNLSDRDSLICISLCLFLLFLEVI